MGTIKQASAPDCVVPWCERRVYDGDAMRLCKQHSDQWRFNLWQTMKVRQAQQMMEEEATASPLGDIALPGRDF
ncbi:hypothetical protein CMI37_34910 [Candidatus Pacearchaeota archaeon]|nr:hypothetical protein [Candidatus Pacearchaeota archaeon]